MIARSRALDRRRRVTPHLRASARYAVNILHRRQQDVALDFAKRGADFPHDHALEHESGLTGLAGTGDVPQGMSTTAVFVAPWVEEGAKGGFAGCVVSFR